MPRACSTWPTPPAGGLRRQLLDGPLAELDDVTSALDAGPAGLGMQEAADRLSAITARVRTISHGLFPAQLATHGLAGAINRPGTPDTRFPPEVEMTAYLAVEPDPAATISLRPGATGPALQISTTVEPEPDLLDRVSALEGAVVRSDSQWRLLLPIGD